MQADWGSGTGWRTAIHELASFERPSASEGERCAAEWIAARLRELGLETTVEAERAHGGYWWSLGLANLLSAGGAIAARRGGVERRLLGALAAVTGAVAIWDEVSGGRLWFRRALFPPRATWNVIASAGDRDAPRTVVVLAHHDAAHSGLIFHPALVSAAALLGARRLLLVGGSLALAASAALANIGASEVVPGANDNLSAVGALIAIAGELRRRPLTGVRVLLVSTGSEESFMEGMRGFGRRHFRELDPGGTEFLCLECLGGPILIVLEGEGMLRMRDYPEPMRDALAGAGAVAGVKIRRGIRTVAATDALIALRAGYPAVTLASIDHTKFPLNYHWPTDTPDALYWSTIQDAIAVCMEFLRARARA